MIVYDYKYLSTLSLPELKTVINTKLNNKNFKNIYNYSLDSLSTMIYYALHDSEIVETLLKTKKYYPITSKIGLKMTTHKYIDEFGHSGYSITQTLHISQNIIIYGIESFLLSINLSLLNL